MDIAGGLISQPVVSSVSNAGQSRAPQDSSVIPAQSVPAVKQTSDEAVNNDSKKNADADRLDRVRSGAKLFKQTLGSGETFAIYRSGSGELVTRFTDRTNGTVRYFPERSMVQFKESIDRQKDTIVDTQA